jgi:cystathionine beta-lyase
VSAFTEKKDRIIIQPPVYQPFFTVVEEQERTLVTNPLKIENGRYVMDYDDLEAKLKMGAKLLILSNPHNPVGRSWTKVELTQLAQLCLRYHCLIVSDEIHSDLMMPGITHIPVATIDEEIAHITITCMSPSKTFNLAGMSISEIIISNKSLRDRFENQVNARLHLQMGNLFGDLALEAAYTYGEEWLEALKIYLAANSACVANALKANFPEIKFYPNEATYLLWMDFSALGFSHEELYRKLIFDCKLGFNDGLLFGKEGKGFMRMNVACPHQKVEEAMGLLLQLKK